MMRASREYSKVLGKINKAISDPIQAKEDQTLLIVMLLGLYEQVRSFAVINGGGMLMRRMR